MNHSDHVRLLQKGIPEQGGAWADFGSGSGAFTLALADLLGGRGEIYSIDREAGALRDQERAMHTRFPDTQIHYLLSDFTRPIKLPWLDGIVMANALHFLKHAEKDRTLQRMLGYLRPGGRFILVEYNVDRGNIWVPYPLSYPAWESIAAHNGFILTRLLATVPSHFLGEIFSALSFKEEK
jgi:ubiquinone/menaquinone biosynthesis C-methylase UbiE